MKTEQQILAFIQGWQHAIRCNENKSDEENHVYKALITIENYINDEN